MEADDGVGSPPQQLEADALFSPVEEEDILDDDDAFDSFLSEMNDDVRSEVFKLHGGDQEAVRKHFGEVLSRCGSRRVSMAHFNDDDLDFESDYDLDMDLENEDLDDDDFDLGFDVDVELEKLRTDQLRRPTLSASKFRLFEGLMDMARGGSSPTKLDDDEQEQLSSFLKAMRRRSFLTRRRSTNVSSTGSLRSSPQKSPNKMDGVSDEQTGNSSPESGNASAVNRWTALRHAVKAVKRQINDTQTQSNPNDLLMALTSVAMGMHWVQRVRRTSISPRSTRTSRASSVAAPRSLGAVSLPPEDVLNGSAAERVTITVDAVGEHGVTVGESADVENGDTNHVANGVMNVVEESTDVVDEATNIVDETTNVVDEPAIVVDESADVVDEPADAVDETADVVDERLEDSEECLTVSDEQSGDDDHEHEREGAGDEHFEVHSEHLDASYEGAPIADEHSHNNEFVDAAEDAAEAHTEAHAPVSDDGPTPPEIAANAPEICVDSALHEAIADSPPPPAPAATTFEHTPALEGHIVDSELEVVFTPRSDAVFGDEDAGTHTAAARLKEPIGVDHSDDHRRSAAISSPLPEVHSFRRSNGPSKASLFSVEEDVGETMEEEASSPPRHARRASLAFDSSDVMRSNAKDSRRGKKEKEMERVPDAKEEEDEEEVLTDSGIEDNVLPHTADVLVPAPPPQNPSETSSTPRNSVSAAPKPSSTAKPSPRTDRSTTSKRPGRARTPSPSPNPSPRSLKPAVPRFRKPKTPKPNTPVTPQESSKPSKKPPVPRFRTKKPSNGHSRSPSPATSASASASASAIPIPTLQLQKLGLSSSTSKAKSRTKSQAKALDFSTTTTVAKSRSGSPSLRRKGGRPHSAGPLWGPYARMADAMQRRLEVARSREKARERPQPPPPTKAKDHREKRHEGERVRRRVRPQSASATRRAPSPTLSVDSNGSSLHSDRDFHTFATGKSPYSATHSRRNTPPHVTVQTRTERETLHTHGGRERLHTHGERGGRRVRPMSATGRLEGRSVPRRHKTPPPSAGVRRRSPSPGSSTVRQAIGKDLVRKDGHRSTTPQGRPVFDANMAWEPSAYVHPTKERSITPRSASRISPRGKRSATADYSHSRSYGYGHSRSGSRERERERERERDGSSSGRMGASGGSLTYRSARSQQGVLGGTSARSSISPTPSRPSTSTSARRPIRSRTPSPHTRGREREKEREREKAITSPRSRLSQLEEKLQRFYNQTEEMEDWLQMQKTVDIVEWHIELVSFVKLVYGALNVQNLQAQLALAVAYVESGKAAEALSHLKSAQQIQRHQRQFRRARRLHAFEMGENPQRNKAQEQRMDDQLRLYYDRVFTVSMPIEGIIAYVRGEASRLKGKRAKALMVLKKGTSQMQEFLAEVENERMICRASSASMTQIDRATRGIQAAIFRLQTCLGLCFSGRDTDESLRYHRAAAVALASALPGGEEDEVSFFRTSMYVTVLKAIAECYEEQQHYKDAQALYDQCQSLAQPVFGEDSAVAADIYYHKGMCFASTEDYVMAWHLLASAHRIWAAVEGDIGVNTLRCATELAAVLVKAARYDEAEDQLKDVIRLKAKSSHAKPTEVADAQKLLGTVYLAQNMLVEAASCYEEAYAIYADANGPEDRTALDMYRRWQQVLKASRKSSSPTHSPMRSARRHSPPRNEFDDVETDDDEEIDDSPLAVEDLRASTRPLYSGDASADANAQLPRERHSDEKVLRYGGAGVADDDDDNEDEEVYSDGYEVDADDRNLPPSDEDVTESSLRDVVHDVRAHEKARRAAGVVGKAGEEDSEDAYELTEEFEEDDDDDATEEIEDRYIRKNRQWSRPPKDEEIDFGEP